MNKKDKNELLQHLTDFVVANILEDTDGASYEEGYITGILEPHKKVTINDKDLIEVFKDNEANDITDWGLYDILSELRELSKSLGWNLEFIDE